MSHIPEINTRIMQLIMALGFTSQTAFGNSVDVSSQRMSNIASGRNQPDVGMCKQILLTHTNVSGDWLMTGEGHMFKSDARKAFHIPKTVTSTEAEIEKLKKQLLELGLYLEVLLKQL